jgi:DNA ligase D-like protein (predicted 3'-phosphoesterase)
MHMPVKKPAGGKIYVIQKHDASHLHWDFRIEIDGVLKSWAIPKEPSNDASVKRLAVEVDDHPLGYEKFEGKIEEGQYGAGEVKIWDSGTYEMIDRKQDKLIIKINGKKLHGEFVLLRTAFSGNKKNWLFFRKKNE